MPAPERNRLSARLRRLPREFLLALVNATAILLIAAAILVLVTLDRIDRFAGNVVATMTEAVLAKIDLPSRDVLANLQGLRSDVRALRQTLSERRENPVIQPEITRLIEALTALNASVDRLTSARTLLTDEAIGRLGRSVTDTLTRARGCASALPAATNLSVPHRELSCSTPKIVLSTSGARQTGFRGERSNVGLVPIGDTHLPPGPSS